MLASKNISCDYEIIVVLNRCSDNTEAIARRFEVKIVREDSRNLAKIRNEGAKNAEGDIIITIDADSRMSKNMLSNIYKALNSGKYIGGGVPVKPERYSVGISLTILLINIALFITGLAGGLYWCFRKDFEAIGGFNEKLSFAEDIEFARRLKKYGKKQGKKFISLQDTFIVTSCRKFDRFGDWFFFKLLLFNGRDIERGFRGKDNSFTDKYFYDFKR
jgi:glycosyltransferase involved in cell wall biosynthesis